MTPFPEIQRSIYKGEERKRYMKRKAPGILFYLSLAHAGVVQLHGKCLPADSFWPIHSQKRSICIHLEIQVDARFLVEAKECFHCAVEVNWCVFLVKCAQRTGFLAGHCKEQAFIFNKPESAVRFFYLLCPP